MLVPLTEPLSPRYVYINPKTNTVHLLVPTVGGQEISTDNTCKAGVEVKNFFTGDALTELNVYKRALEADIAFLKKIKVPRADKEARLTQIETYIEAIPGMEFHYRAAINAAMQKPSNLYGIQLRPREQDFASKVVNPTFNINRENSPDGSPASALFRAIHQHFPGVTMPPAPRAMLTTAVLENLPASPCFSDIQQVLGEQCLNLFGLPVNFMQKSDGTRITQRYLDTLMDFDLNTEPEDYIEALLGACALAMWVMIPSAPFYSITITDDLAKKAEQLSILTQFFIANVNVYCRAKNLSPKNFGVILDGDESLSQGLVKLISATLSTKGDVEKALCDFCNAHSTKFGLSRALNTEDITAIRQKFERTYRTVTATKENPHMDDFLILDTEDTGQTAKFVTHQGAICINFAELIDPAMLNQTYFASIRTDFMSHPIEIPHKNEWIQDSIDVDPASLLLRLDNDTFETLPEDVKKTCQTHPLFKLRQFLDDVAKGKQEEAEAKLTSNSTDLQTMLRTPGTFTDYSGRTFYCTAYEYAHWAKDTHMCRMLALYMDENTNAIMLDRMDNTDRAGGLEYTQNGQQHHSLHFDLNRLINAIHDYINFFTTSNPDFDVAKWKKSTAPDKEHVTNITELCAKWIGVGTAQLDVPAHVAQEYCRQDRSFTRMPATKEEKFRHNDPNFKCCSMVPSFDSQILPRELNVYNKDQKMHWYQKDLLGSRAAVSRMCLPRASIASWSLPLPRGFRTRIQDDLDALIYLDKIRTEEVNELRQNLAPPSTECRCVLQ